MSNMDDDEYAEYVRAGMWRVKNKAEVERMERAEKERKEREERERRERDKLAREERERIRKLEERKKRKSKEDAEAARTRYDDGWRKLQQAVAAVPVTKSSTATPEPTTDATAAATEAASPATTDLAAFPLRFSDFPWPLYPPMAFPPLSWPTLDDISSASISSFLLPDSLPADKHKTVLRQAVLAYHPDRFERYVLKIPEDKEDVRERVRELGLRVSQVLNDLSKKSS